MNVHDISEYQLYKLKSIDPAIDDNWHDFTNNLFLDLDEESRSSIYHNILKSKGVQIDLNKNLVYKRPDTLMSVIKSIQSNNKELMSAALDMSNIMTPSIKSYNAMSLADRVEATISHLDNIDVQESLLDQKNRLKIRNAFLYDLALWIDNIQINTNPGLRQLNSDITKAYFKEVFIKHELQGRDFRAWNSANLSFQNLSHLPEFIKENGKQRKFFVVEGNNYWFLVGSADEIDKNPYSFRRFIHEESSSSETTEYIYLTHIVLSKDSISDKKYLDHASYCMTRLYTLDKGVSDTVIKFINDIQNLNIKYLEPLLKGPLEQNGSLPEVIVTERLLKYENQLSLLILQKIPVILKSTLQDDNDRVYLFYHLDQLIKQMSESLQDFRLEPLVMYSESVEITIVKLLSIRQLINNLRVTINSQKYTLENYSQILETALIELKETLLETEASLKELEQLKEGINKHNSIKETGSFWQKLKLGKQPKYTLDDIIKTSDSLQENCYISIVRLAKNKKESIIYPEFDFNETINDKYRHYAIADGNLGIGCLPRVVRLNEDRSKFNIESVKKIIY